VGVGVGGRRVVLWRGGGFARGIPKCLFLLNAEPLEKLVDLYIPLQEPVNKEFLHTIPSKARSIRKIKKKKMYQRSAAKRSRHLRSEKKQEGKQIGGILKISGAADGRNRKEQKKKRIREGLESGREVWHRGETR